MGAMYLKMPSYKGGAADEVGINPILANIAVKNMTIMAELNCLMYRTRPKYKAAIIQASKMIKSKRGFIVFLYFHKAKYFWLNENTTKN